MSKKVSASISDYLSNIGEKGGMSTSPAKQAASRANGRKSAGVFGKKKKVNLAEETLDKTAQKSKKGK